MFFVYILYSVSTNAYYIGQTLDLEVRIEEHNSKFYDKTSTAKAKDWELYFSINCETRTQAILIESHIKSMKSRKYYESLKKHPEISQRLKNKFQ